MRARLSRDVVAAALGLRFLYTEALTGKRELVNQELAISLEELSQTLVSLVGMTLPSSMAERGQLPYDFEDTPGMLSLRTRDGLNPGSAHRGGDGSTQLLLARNLVRLTMLPGGQ